MNITFRQGSEELSGKLIEQAQTKLLKFSRLVAEKNSEAQVLVDVERESNSHQNSESLWRASINLEMAGNRFNAVGKGGSPNKATEIAIKELKREVRKAKGRQLTLVRKGREALKRLRQGAS